MCNTKALWLTLTLLIVFSAGAGAALLFTREVPNTVTIISAPQPNLQVYSDAACTTEVTSLDWGQVMKGSTATRQVWVKNVGDVNFVSVSITSDLLAVTGALIGTPDGYGLTTGAKQAVTLSLQIAPTASDGATTFKIFVQGSD